MSERPKSLSPAKPKRLEPSHAAWPTLLPPNSPRPASIRRCLASSESPSPVFWWPATSSRGPSRPTPCQPRTGLCLRESNGASTRLSPSLRTTNVPSRTRRTRRNDVACALCPCVRRENHRVGQVDSARMKNGSEGTDKQFRIEQGV